jgi:two-component system response regulator FixJ
MSATPIGTLLIEDNEADAYLMRAALSQSRYGMFSMTRVRRLADGLETLAREPFDVILLDLGLPDSQGLKTLEREVSTVHVIDDDAGMRKSLKMVLESASLRACTYDSAEKFLEAAPNFDQPGCIVLDLRMKAMGGIELLQRLRLANVDIPVLIISGHADVATAVRGMQLGAVDVLQKPFEPSVLVEIVRRAIQGSREIIKRRQELDAVRRRISILTKRELDLVRLLISGRSNKQIAADLGISVKTVTNHRSSVMSKTGALNAADLTRLAMLFGIVPAEDRHGR